MRQNRSHVVAPSTRAASEISGWHVDEVRAHPEDGKRHVQADQRQHDREPGVVDAHGTFQVVERDDDAAEGKRQPEHEQKQKHARAGDAQVADGKPGHRRDDQRNRHDSEHDERARCQERGHVRDIERFDEVAPLRVRGPFKPTGHRSRRMQRGHEDADEGQDRDRHQPNQERPTRPEFATTDLHCVGLPAQALDGEDDDQNQNHEHDGQRRRQANPLLGEGKDVDLDSRNRRRVSGSAGRRNVDDVKRGKRGNHRDGEADADLVPEQAGR